MLEHVLGQKYGEIFPRHVLGDAVQDRKPGFRAPPEQNNHSHLEGRADGGGRAWRIWEPGMTPVGVAVIGPMAQVRWFCVAGEGDYRRRPAFLGWTGTQIGLWCILTSRGRRFLRTGDATPSDRRHNYIWPATLPLNQRTSRSPEHQNQGIQGST
jgi:hypothetical protein